MNPLNPFRRFLLHWRENYIDTLAKMFDYCTSLYEDNKLSVLLDGDAGYTYGEFRKVCDAESARLCRYGVGAGDKVAILSPNTPNWTVAFFTAVAFGRVSVPILANSSEDEIENILTHSGTKVLYVSKRLLHKVREECLNRMTLVVDIETLKTIRRDEEAFTCEGHTAVPQPDDIAALIYTSGTTGNAKGVMLSHRNFLTNVKIAFHTHKTTESDRWLSILPMPHTYELSIGVLYPFFVGACVYYISKPPSTSVLVPAMKKVRPTIILSVPLVIEKVYRNSVVPIMQHSRFLKWMGENMSWLLYPFIGMKLRTTFGGCLKFFGIGGAKLDETVEAFLKKAKFPYSIGYGMTECAPLICTAAPKLTHVGSTGCGAWGVSVRLNNVDAATGEGEIVVKGDNVMLGYYKDAARTREAFTDDGWLRTRDLASQDRKGRFYIKGRLGNMIIGPSGENIYPEEIEEVINNMDAVSESLVVERGGHLVALVNLNENILDWNFEKGEKLVEKIEGIKEAVLSYVNKHVGKSSKVSSVEVVEKPFEKTATMKIRRFLYKDSNTAAPSQSVSDSDSVSDSE